ncbi:hypothetical protein M0802_006650 [Mischocyttarus mexicanus]|nr:hypothetical protein M0802_006650 [Mischocyttarus mexicanus]
MFVPNELEDRIRGSGSRTDLSIDDKEDEQRVFITNVGVPVHWWFANLQHGVRKRQDDEPISKIYLRINN